MTRLITSTDNFPAPTSDRITPASELRRLAWSDGLGAMASVGCAIHCATMPLVVSYLPALGLELLVDNIFHQIMAVTCFVFAFAAFIPGLWNHRSPTPLVIGVLGICMLSVAAFGFEGRCCSPWATFTTTNVADIGESHYPDGEYPAELERRAPSSIQNATPSPPKNAGLFLAFLPWVTPLGGFTLVVAHLLNHRLSCARDCCRGNTNRSSPRE